ncbi:MAG: ATP-binding protein [Planctomycetota bacterium]
MQFQSFDQLWVLAAGLGGVAFGVTLGAMQAIAAVRQRRASAREDQRHEAYRHGDQARLVEPPSAVVSSVLDAIDGAVCIVDAEGIVRDCNRRWEGLACFGGAAMPRVGHRLASALRDGPAPIRQGLAGVADRLDAFLAGEPAGSERDNDTATHRVQIGPKTLWLNATISGIDDPGGRAAAILCLVDVTERTEADRAAVTARTHAEMLTEALHSSRRTLALTMQAAGIATWQWDTETGHVEYSQRWAELIGRPRELVEPSIDELMSRVHPNDLTRLEEHLATCLEEGGAHGVDCEFRVRLESGGYRWVQSKGRVIQHRTTGVPLVLAGVMLDIDQRKEAETRSRDLAQILEEASNELLVVDASTFQVVEGNRGARGNMGYELEELRAKRLPELLTHESHAELLRLLASDGSGDARGAPFNGHFRRHDGSTYSVAARVQRATYLGVPAIAIHGVDVTEKELLESQLSQAQKLESIGQLAAGVAHEINTPMQFVGSNVDFLKASIPQVLGVIDTLRGMLGAESLPPEVSARIAEVDDALESQRFAFLQDNVPAAIDDCAVGVSRVVEIVRAMKDFSHPGSKDKSLASVNELLRSAVVVSKNRWKYVSTLELELDPTVPPIECLPAELNQVFLNLIVNAADAIAEHRSEEDDLGGILVRTRAEGESITIEVQDTGPGIPAEHACRVFDPFFTTKDVGKGTGQGLAISHDVVVNKHGGAIGVESAPGEGARFRVVLPLHHESANPPARQDGRAPLAQP